MALRAGARRSRAPGARVGQSASDNSALTLAKSGPDAAPCPAAEPRAN